MKRFIPLAALFALAACVTAPAAQAPEPAQEQSVSVPVPRSLAVLQAAGGENAPTQAQIEALLGAPDITRRDGAGAALTYRYEQCALLLLFTADSRNQMRLAQAHPSARRGGAAPSLAQCAVEADARGA
ncbi:MAG TPA: hypothetical protein PLK37_05155 [Terricaulis sp.]|nr:hypothetical protein [Terricaulis sp.]